MEDGDELVDNDKDAADTHEEDESNYHEVFVNEIRRKEQLE